MFQDVLHILAVDFEIVPYFRDYLKIHEFIFFRNNLGPDVDAIHYILAIPIFTNR